MERDPELLCGCRGGVVIRMFFVVALGEASPAFSEKQKQTKTILTVNKTSNYNLEKPPPHAFYPPLPAHIRILPATALLVDIDLLSFPIHFLRRISTTCDNLPVGYELAGRSLQRHKA
jgi:hypothetical protein